jgi:SAM-dependent methyltransferase
LAQKVSRWKDLSQDPNSLEAKAYRAASVEETAARSLIQSRVGYICELADGKDILDVGVVEHVVEAADSETWLHGKLRARARTCLGVDILEEGIRRLRDRGFDVVCADLTQGPLDRTFDLIVCGEVLEHLPAPQVLVSNLARMLRAGGRIAVTAPNPWYLNTALKAILGRHPYPDSADHVCWFDPATIAELAERAGLKLARWTGVEDWNPRTFKARVLFSSRSLLTAMGVNPVAFSKTLFYELVKI